MDESGLSQENVLSIVINIYKLSIARRGYYAAVAVQNNLKGITGAEGIDDIISQIEEPIFEFTGQITTQGAGVVSLGATFSNVMTALANTPQDRVGLPTGFPSWDAAIGGGLRPATVNVVGARPKQGKSFFCMNVARNMAENGIPVLYLDKNLLAKHNYTA